MDTGRTYLHYVAKDIINHPSFKSVLVMGMACFDYSTLFFPLPQVSECYRNLFKSFSSRGWLAEEMKNVHMDNFMELINQFHQVSSHNAISGPVDDDMVTFFAHCPELSRRGYILYVVELCCLCLGHFCPVLPSMGLSCPSPGIETNDLSTVTEPLQSFLLCGELANTSFTDPESIAFCVKLVDTFGEHALRARYDPWEIVNIHERAKIVQESSKSNKVVRVASDVDASSMSTVLQSPGD